MANSAALHAFHKQSINRQIRTDASAYQKRKSGESGPLGRSVSTPSINPPWGLHEVPEDELVCHPSAGSGAEAVPARPYTGTSGARGASGAGSKASYGRWLRQHGHGINRKRHTLLSPPTTSSTGVSSLRSSAQLLFYDQQQRGKTPQRVATPSEKSVADSHWTSISQRSSASLRREVEQAVQDEVAKAVRPLQERLQSERSKREHLETQLRRCTPSAG